MQERGITMFIHAVLISIILYLVMVFIMKQSSVVAENRSFLLGAIVLIYMILFGHGLPTSINKNIM